MTKQQRIEAIEFIEGQLKNGYVDLSSYDEDSLEIIKEAIDILKTVDKLSSIGCTSFQMTADGIKEIYSDAKITINDMTKDGEITDCKVINVGLIT